MTRAESPLACSWSWSSRAAHSRANNCSHPQHTNHVGQGLLQRRCPGRWRAPRRRQGLRPAAGPAAWRRICAATRSAARRRLPTPGRRRLLCALIPLTSPNLPHRRTAAATAGTTVASSSPSLCTSSARRTTRTTWHRAAVPAWRVLRPAGVSKRSA